MKPVARTALGVVVGVAAAASWGWLRAVLHGDRELEIDTADAGPQAP